MSEKQSILNQYGVPHQVHQDVVQLAEAAWLEVVDQHIKTFSPIDKRIFLEYAMFGLTGACASRMIITGIEAKQASREHVIDKLNKKYGSPAGLRQAISDDYKEQDD